MAGLYSTTGPSCTLQVHMFTSRTSVNMVTKHMATNVTLIKHCKV